MDESQPPRFARWIVETVAPVSTYASSIVGDLDEGFRVRAAASVREARRWYRIEATILLARYGVRRFAPEGFTRDVAYAFRGMRRAPVFAAVVALTLAIGIGANVAILGIIDAAYVRKLPVPAPEQLVGVTAGDRRAPNRIASNGIGIADFKEIRASLRGVDDVAAYVMMDLDAGDSAISVQPTRTALVSGTYFRTLGVAPQRGRFIQPDEEESIGAHAVVVISDHLWRERYRAADAVLGQSLWIGGKSFVIVGVTPPHFTGLHPEGRTDLWLPYSMADGLSSTERGTVRSLDVFARRSVGSTLAEVRASADRVSRQLQMLRPATDSTLALQVRTRDRLADARSGTGVVLFGTVWVVVALIHLALCMNVASLMLARTANRRVEMGVRLCLGASGGRIVRQCIVDAMALAVPGVIVGLGAGWLFSTLITQMQFLSAMSFVFDLRSAVLVAVVAVFTVLQFGLLPALEASRADPVALLRGSSRRARFSGRRLEMVSVVQVAISVVLLADAIAFVSLFQRQQAVEPGYDVAHTAVAELRVPARASGVDWRALHDEAISRLRALPGVISVASADGTPMYKMHWMGELSIPGQAQVTGAPARMTSLQAIGPDYFATLGVPVLRGREFTVHDDANGARRSVFDVVIVNEELARRLWPGQDPIGKALQVDRSTPATVIGIVRDMHDVSSVNLVERAYFPLLESTTHAIDVVVRTSDPAAVSASRIMGAIRTAPVFARATIRTLGGIRDGFLDMSRTAASGLLAAACIAVALTAIGLYGLVAMCIAQRRREIGIRLALGAQRVDITALLVNGTARVVAAGGLLGLIIAAGLVQVQRSWIGSILSMNVLIMMITASTLIVAAAVALALPLWRASRDVPAIMLR